MVTPTEIKEISEYLVPSLYQRYKIRFKRMWDLYTDSPFGLIGLFLVLLFSTIAIFAPVLSPFNPNTSMVGGRNVAPSMSHPLGTNRVGQDIFSQLIHGTQVSLLVGLTAAFIAVIIGTLFGLIAGYYGGWLDTILMRTTDFFIQLPLLPLMLILLAFQNELNDIFTTISFGVIGKLPSIIWIILVIGLLGWTGTARIIRSKTLSIKERAFIEATRSIGASNSHIIFSHILPNILPLVFANAILGVVDAIIAESGISFLGFGDMETWTWGRVLYEARFENVLITGAWWHFIPPGLCIMLLALGFSLISFSLNEILNPKLRQR
jgi:peptide/nickel transport system permease protein